MRTRAALFGFLAASVCLAAQDTFSFERTNKLNDKDDYSVSFSITTLMGQADIQMVLTTTVKKVYENGEVDVESRASGLKTKFNDKEQDLSNRPQPPAEVRYSKYGVPLETGTVSRGPINTNFLRLVNVIPDRPIKVGETITVEYKDPKQEKSTVKGTVMLESIKDGVAVLVSKLDVTNEQTASPMKFVMTRTVDVATKKMNKVNGTVSNLPKQNGVQITAVQFAMERKS